MKDKKSFIDGLSVALQGESGVAGLEYFSPYNANVPYRGDLYYDEAVVITFDDGYQKVVNVGADSNLAMVSDIVRALI